MKSHTTHYPLIGIVIFLAMLTWTVQGSSTAPHTTRGPLQWSGDGSKLAFVEGSTVTILDAVSGAVMSGLTAPAAINAVSWSPDNQFLAIGTNNGEVIIWDIAEEDPMKILTLEYPRILSLIWYPDGSRLLVYVATDDLEYTTQYLWDTLDFRLVSQQPGGMYFAMAFDPTGTQLAQLAVRAILVREAESLRIVRRIDLGGDMGNVLNSIAWSPDGSKLLTGSERGELFIWDLNQEEEPWIKTVLHPSMNSDILSVSFSADGSSLMAINAEGYAARFEVSTGMRIAEATFPVNAAAVWSPYGERIVYQRQLEQRSDRGAQVVVPFVTLENLTELLVGCTSENRLAPDSLDALPDFVAQVESLPEGAIPAACRADLLAVAGALR